MPGRQLPVLLLCLLCPGSTGLSSALRPSATQRARCRSSLIRLQIGGPPRIVLIWNSPEPFVYENNSGGADLAPLGRSTARFSTLAQALALGRKLEAASRRITYCVYLLGDGEMELKGSYPKQVNAVGAKVKFRKRKPRTGGAEDRQLGVGGMGDDVWCVRRIWVGIFLGYVSAHLLRQLRSGTGWGGGRGWWRR
jgi:hypothetical protein